VAQAKAAYAAHYTALNGGVRDGVYEAAAFYYRAELAALLPERPQAHAARALDVGCGYGLLLRFLHDSGFGGVDGIELDAALHASAQEFTATLEHWSGKIWQGDALALLPTLASRYDLVTAYDILEHFDLDGARELAARVRGALAPHGRAVFRTPNMANVLGIYSRCMDLTHQVGFTEQSLTQLLQLAGFARVELVDVRYPPGHPLTEKLARSRTFHRELFELQDRSMPRCFDKNLVMVGHA
jgi:2-polyprenyl-3-methyl-5-hydroxy-6-metoxy-1,4-benzoquinol methylase